MHCTRNSSAESDSQSESAYTVGVTLSSSVFVTLTPRLCLQEQSGDGLVAGIGGAGGGGRILRDDEPHGGLARTLTGQREPLGGAGIASGEARFFEHEGWGFIVLQLRSERAAVSSEDALDALGRAARDVANHPHRDEPAPLTTAPPSRCSLRNE